MVGLFCYSSIKIIQITSDRIENQQLINELQQLKTVVEENEEIKEESKFASLQKVNDDFVGWITIENTQINYPVVQADDNEYYLDKNFEKQNTLSGSIFIDFRNKLTEENKNIILYGHRMKDGTMFGELNKFLNADFFVSSPTIQFETLEKNYHLEVFSTYLTTTDFNYIQTDFSNDDEYVEFLQQLYDRSVYKKQVELTPNTKIVTFSTCDYSLDSEDGRLVVHAIVVEEA